MNSMSRSLGAARASAGGHLALTLVLILVLVTALAGCGGSSGDSTASMSAAEILAASQAAAKSAGSVHVVSRISQGKLAFTLELELAADAGRGRLSVFGISYEVLRVGGTVYVKGNAAFYRRLLHGSRLRVPPGTWLKATIAAGRLTGLAKLTDMSHELGLLLRSTGQVAKRSTTVANGRQVVQLEETGNKLFTASLSIAATGKPYPVQIVKRGRERGQTTFSGWNQPIAVSAPAHAVAIAELAGKR